MDARPAPVDPPSAIGAVRRPVFARHAASLVVLRETIAGPSVLMGLRGAGHRFLPNHLVFPGGAVDPEDGDVPCAAPLPDHVQALLAKAARPRLAQALAMAAARELAEETGLSLGNPPDLDGLDYLCRAVTPPIRPLRFNARFFIVAEGRVAGELGGSGELTDIRYFPIAEALALPLHRVQRGVLEQVLRWRAMSADVRATRPRTPLFRNERWIEE